MGEESHRESTLDEDSFPSENESPEVVKEGQDLMGQCSPDAVHGPEGPANPSLPLKTLVRVNVSRTITIVGRQMGSMSGIGSSRVIDRMFKYIGQEVALGTGDRGFFDPLRLLGLFPGSKATTGQLS